MVGIIRRWVKTVVTSRPGNSHMSIWQTRNWTACYRELIPELRRLSMRISGVCGRLARAFRRRSGAATLRRLSTHAQSMGTNTRRLRTRSSDEASRTRGILSSGPAVHVEAALVIMTLANNHQVFPNRSRRPLPNFANVAAARAARAQRRRLKRRVDRKLQYLKQSTLGRA